MRDRDGTLVFVEVRVRRDARFGGAAASIGVAKRQRLVFAAGHFRPPRQPAAVPVRRRRRRRRSHRAAFDAG